MDNVDRMATMAASSSSILVRFFAGSDVSGLPSPFNFTSAVSSFQSSVAARSSLLMDELRKEYITGKRGPTPASQHLGKTRPVYEFIRKNLDVRMHGYENYNKFANGLGVDDITVGQNISRIYEVRSFASIFYPLIRACSRFVTGKCNPSLFRYSIEVVCVILIAPRTKERCLYPQFATASFPHILMVVAMYFIIILRD
jgi:hypothetical protein